MKTLLVILAMTNAGIVAGCGDPHVIIVPATKPRQLAEQTSAYVFVFDKDGNRVRSANRVPLFAGEWVLSDPGPKDSGKK